MIFKSTIFATFLSVLLLSASSAQAASPAVVKGASALYTTTYTHCGHGGLRVAWFSSKITVRTWGTIDYLLSLPPKFESFTATSVKGAAALWSLKRTTALKPLKRLCASRGSGQLQLFLKQLRQRKKASRVRFAFEVRLNDHNTRRHAWGYKTAFYQLRG